MVAMNGKEISDEAAKFVHYKRTTRQSVQVDGYKFVVASKQRVIFDVDVTLSWKTKTSKTSQTTEVYFLNILEIVNRKVTIFNNEILVRIRKKPDLFVCTLALTMRRPKP